MNKHTPGPWLVAEMYQLIENVAAAYEHDKSRHDLSATLYELRCKALQLLEKLEEERTQGETQ